MPADEELRGDVQLLTGAAPAAAGRGRHRRHQRRGEPHRARVPPSRCCSRVRPRSSPSSARSASAVRRTSAAPRRRTSTPRPHRSSSARPGMFDAINVSASRRRQPGRSREAPQRHRSRRRRGGHREDRGQGELRRGQEGPQGRRDPVHDLRRGRAVRRLVHHLEHLHDDRHAALAGDRVAAGDRQHSPPDPRQPAAGGAAARRRGIGRRHRRSAWPWPRASTC